ncbi:MAG: hypothetical protein IJT88_00200 [Kiritimatiellae bacterium]|nr:hypothetical protein [Kiritimatiellia bacterium]
MTEDSANYSLPPMMPDLQSALLCDDVRQERNGKFILIGLYDALALHTFPSRQPRLCIVTRWCSGLGTFTQHTRIVAPDQETVIMDGRLIPVELTSPEASRTNVELFMNVTFREPGTYWMEILLDNDLKLRFPLRVIQRTPPPPGTPGMPPPGEGPGF